MNTGQISRAQICPNFNQFKLLGLVFHNCFYCFGQQWKRKFSYKQDYSQECSVLNLPIYRQIDGQMGRFQRTVFLICTYFDLRGNCFTQRAGAGQSRRKGQESKCRSNLDYSLSPKYFSNTNQILIFSLSNIFREIKSHL